MLLFSSSNLKQNQIASLFKIVFYKLDNNHKTRMFGVSWPYGSQLNSICFKKGAVWKRLGANPKEEEAWSEPFSLAVIWTPWTPRFRGDTRKTNKVTWYLIYSWLSVFHSIYILTVYLQFRINLTMYLLALMIYLVTIVSAKKKGTNDFFLDKHEFTKFYKILTILHLKQNDFSL